MFNKDTFSKFTLLGVLGVHKTINNLFNPF